MYVAFLYHVSTQSGRVYFLQHQTLHDVTVKPAKAVKRSIADDISVVTFIARGTKKNEGTRVVFTNLSAVHDVSCYLENSSFFFKCTEQFNMLAQNLNLFNSPNPLFRMVKNKRSLDLRGIIS